MVKSKRYTIFGLIVILVITMFGQIAPEQVDAAPNITKKLNQRYILKASSLNVRSGDSTSYGIVGQVGTNVINHGNAVEDKVQAIGRTSNGWLKIKFGKNGKKTGYISGSSTYVKKDPSQEPPATTHGKAKVPTIDSEADSDYEVIGDYGSNTKLELFGAEKFLKTGNTLDHWREGKSTPRRDHRKVWVQPTSGHNGKFGGTYTNVATYKGKSLDLRFTFDHLKYPKGKNRADVKGEYIWLDADEIAFSMGGYKYVDVKIEYYYSDIKKNGSDRGKPAKDITGSYMTVSDIDNYQSLGFKSAQLKKIDSLYVEDDTIVQTWKDSSYTMFGETANFDRSPNEMDAMMTILSDGNKLNFRWNKNPKGSSPINDKYGRDTPLYKHFGMEEHFMYRSEKPIRTKTPKPHKEARLSVDDPKVDKDINIGEPFVYVIDHNVPSEWKKFYYKSYVMEDKMNKALKINKVRIVNGLGNNVRSRFNVEINHKSNVVKASATKKALDSSYFYGQDYKVIIDTEVKDSPLIYDSMDSNGKVTINNKVKYTINNNHKTSSSESPFIPITVKPNPLKLGLENIEIYTNKSDKGLTADVSLKHLGMNPSVKNFNFTLDVHQRNIKNHSKDEKLMTSQSFKVSDLDKSTDFKLKIPKDKLKKADGHNYEVSLTTSDGKLIKLDPKTSKIDTDGYTSTEETIKANSSKQKAKFEGVVKTSRKQGGNMKEYKEYLSVTQGENQKTKSGYKYDLHGEVKYTNDIMDDIKKRFNINTKSDTFMTIDSGIVDKTLSFYDEGSDKAKLKLDVNKDNDKTKDIVINNAKKLNQVTYQSPKSFIERLTGDSFLEGQTKDGKSYVDAKNHLYIPVWIDNLGIYDLMLSNDNKKPLGIHNVNFELTSEVDVYAYMYSHTDSDTSEIDEILLRPIMKDEIPDSWLND